MTGLRSLVPIFIAGCFVGVPPLADEGAGGASGSGGGSCTPGTFEACYDGPEGTLDASDYCRAGTAECLADGQLGPCTNQVLPAIERCNTDPDMQDEDCNGSVNEHCAAWAQKYGVWGRQGVEALSLTSAGDALIAGPTTGAIDFGDGNLTPTGGTRSFVAKLDPSLARCPDAHCWSQLLAGTGDTRARGVTESESGDVLLVGAFTNRLDLGGLSRSSSSSSYAMFVALLAGSDGAAQWISWYGTASNDEELFDIAPRAGGGGTAVGYTTGTIDFGTTAGTVTANGQDVLVLALDDAGVAQWAHGYGGAGDDRAVRVIPDGDGNVYVTGWFAEQIDFGCSGEALTSGGDQDVFVAKLTPSGGCAWSVAFGGPEAQRGQALVIADDRLLVGIVFEGSIAGDGLMLESAGDTDLLIAELDLSSGMLVDHVAFGAGGTQEPWDLALGPGGSIAVALSLSGSIDFGGGTIDVPDVGGDIDDAGLLVLESDGTHRFSRSFGGLRGDDDAFQVAFDAQGRLWAAGEFDGSLDFGTGVMFSNGVDAFLLRIDDP